MNRTSYWPPIYPQGRLFQLLTLIVPNRLLSKKVEVLLKQMMYYITIKYFVITLIKGAIKGMYGVIASRARQGVYGGKLSFDLGQFYAPVIHGWFHLIFLFVLIC